MGSVKDLQIIKPATDDEAGIGRFVFSDRYSVFDWGEMPDLIEDKGKALCVIGAYFFELLEEHGIKTHYRGLVEDGEVKRLADLNAPSDTMEVSLVQVHKPPFADGDYDYSSYNNSLRNYLIPLEVIYRKFLPKGSSVFKRIERGAITPKDLGLDGQPGPGTQLPTTFLEVSTKLEETDRYISWNEGQRISGMNEVEISQLKATAERIESVITTEVARLGLNHEDGKVEFGYDSQRNLVLVDVLGTPDECRFTYEGRQVSKEVARQYYTNTQWKADIDAAKENARQQGIREWKTLCPSTPEPLPADLKRIVVGMYTATANGLTGREIFQAPPIQDIVQDYIKFLGA